MPRRKREYPPINLEIDSDTVKQMGHASEDNFFDMCADPNMGAILSAFDRGPVGGEDIADGFAMGMMCHQLVMLESRIIMAEHRPGPVVNIEEERKRYAQKRATAEKMKGFQQAYENAREEHNECARANLDNSDGTVYTAVVPKFNSDGTHEPWGERDVPWNAPKR